jgi:hypothetical protein
LIRRGEVDPVRAAATSPRHGNCRLLLDVVRDRERDLIVLDAGVENLVVEEGGRLWFEEDTGTLRFDHLVVLGRQRSDVDLQVRLRSCPLGDHPQTRRLRKLVRGRDNVLHGPNRASGECEQRAHLLPGWFRSETGEASNVTPEVAGSRPVGSALESTAKRTAFSPLTCQSCGVRTLGPGVDLPDLQADRVYEVGGWGEGALTARVLPPARAFGSPWPLSACRPGGSLLSGSSVAPVYRFLLMLRNGEAADPPAFLTEQPYWKPGDVFVAANGRAFRVVEIDAEVEVAGMVLFDSIWTIEPFEE